MWMPLQSLVYYRDNLTVMSYLLVDDDDISNFLNKRTLENAGIRSEIHTAMNGRQALDLFNSYFLGTRPIPHTILLDLNMPVMDGFTFIEAFRKINHPSAKNVRIIIVTSSNNPADAQRARMLGITHFLQKPLSIDALTEALVA